MVTQKLDFDFTLPANFSAKRAREVERRKAEPLPKEKETPETLKVEKPKKVEKQAPVKSPDEKVALIKTEESPTKLSRDLSKKALRNIKVAKTRDTLSNVVLHYFATIFERAALLLVTKDHIVGWCARGKGFENNITNVKISREMKSVFQNVINKKDDYCGLWNPEKGDFLFFESLEATRAEEVTVIPCIRNDKVFACFYADNYKMDPHAITTVDSEIPNIKKVSEAFSDKFFMFLKKK